MKACKSMVGPFRFKKKLRSRFSKISSASSSSSSSSFSSLNGAIPVFLNVYDLTPTNGYFYWLGFGVFHTGIEVHGVEYAFGAHDNPSSGVFEVEPKQCPGFKFRKSIFMGTTNLDPAQVGKFIEKHAVNYNGDTYHLIIKNCNHFCNDLCLRLTGRHIPGWVNRLARIGSLCNCLLPAGLHVTGVLKGEKEGEKRSLRSEFRRVSSLSGRDRFLFMMSPRKRNGVRLQLKGSKEM